jgi:Uma2 family endonuclease
MLVDLDPPFVLIRPAVSEAEFYAQEGEDSDWEYLDGRLVMSPSSDRHEALFGFLLSLLHFFLDVRGGGVVRGSRYPMRLDERWSPEPDVMVVREEHRHRMTAKRLEGPADGVIEIASEADPKFDVREKLPRYREAGIEEIWFLDSFLRTLRVETRTAEGYKTATVSSGRISSVVVSGFWIEVDWLWHAELPSVNACLREILG